MKPAAREHLIDAMTRLADGERAAFDPVYEALWPMALAFARKTVGDEAEDVAQSALLKLLGNAGNYRPGTDPVPWVLSLVVWEGRTVRRRQERRREAPLDDVSLHDVHATADHGAALERRNLIEAALEVMGRMDEEDRAHILAALDDEPRSPLNARDRKRRQRALGRLRLAFWRSHG